jgi:hypothetical protein
MNPNQPDQTYFDLTDQFQEDYVSDRLKEVSAYYSNRLSYLEVVGLVERVTGTQQLSDQKLRQMVVNNALSISQALQTEVEDPLKKETRSFPKIAEKVDIYDGGSREVLVFEDAIQVRGQKENRQHKQGVEQKLTDRDAEKTKTPAIQTDIVILEKKDGGFEYITAPINDRGHEAIPLPALVKSRVIQEYGKEVKPLPVVAITDGAKVIRQHLGVVFGATLIIILDWYHLGKKVRDLMSMIALTKEDQRRHLKFMFYQLWHGHIYTVLHYLKTKVQPKNQEKHLELIAYLEKHRSEIIDDRRRKKAGKPIGSGYMEKGCDQVIGRRQKKKGMSWREVGSRSLGLLKVAELNNHWEALWFPKEAANDSSNLRLVSNL